ncbi:UvrD-helicase domain-containing protein [Kangiella koreensis]|uniref:DNA 3'-5' helicase n=1 Tax=Kangiella koreensis (strain DSM 16069 / JCM 12317 / KCTC 12182 / SW-125) TaxID=523791 RepID=C7R658_KANKD|nr:ATP-dependent helicase [Kangiella koreensis]ACV25489.1 UvrD/REP helicase [Kangiella koreensis DSM 16069]
MSKYQSVESWKPSDGFISTEVANEVIKEKNNNLAILAGPGAGKTEILAQRANYLLQTGLCKSPQKILALTFKVDAASNIKNRIDLRCGRELASRFESSTFDAFFISLVRRFSTLLPSWIDIPSDFDVYPFDHNWWSDYEQNQLGGRPFVFKNNYSPLDLTARPNDEITRLWKYCAENKIADYKMCRSMAFTIIKNYSQVRYLILSTYKYLFLDEFQDTTDEQFAFIQTVFKGSNTIISAVGDTNQMIMAWAGANPQNFEKLAKDFNSKTVHLMVNHRSNTKIINLINHVIQDLTTSMETPVVYVGTRKGAPPYNCIGAKAFDSPESEAAYISKHINLTLSENPTLAPSDFALILRQRAQDYYKNAIGEFLSNDLSLRNEDALVVSNGVKIQDLMVEPLSIFWMLLIRYKAGLINYSQEKKLDKIASFFTGYNLGQERERKKLKAYIARLMSCINFSEPVENTITKIFDIVGSAKIKLVYPQYRSQYFNKVKESFCILFQDALNNNPKDLKQAINDYEGTNQVKLMTIHKSKGLEFDTVFFVDFHDDSWWGLRRAVQEKNEKSQREEKNTFFVGLSRAEERLYFTKNRGNWPPVLVGLLKDSNLVVQLPDI